MRLIFKENWPGYPLGIFVCFGGVRKDMILGTLERHGCSREGCLKEWDWTPKPQVTGHCAVLPCMRVALWFPTAEPAPHTIAHECFHAAYGILPQLGIELCQETEEVYAYAIDYLFSAVSDMVRRAKV
jgi:hypothetical protein